MDENQEIHKSSKYLLPPKTTNKKTLVLDLDETLVHSQFFEFSVPSDITIKIEIENEIYDIHILVRPGVEKFIEIMKDFFEIVIFTASISKYADILMDIIDPNHYCLHRLFREHCTFINNNYVKDLTRLGRNLKDIIIVDNSPLSYCFHPNNGLPILSWFDNYNDYELENITPILLFLSSVNDVRDYIPLLVKDNEISYINAEKLLKKHGFLIDDDSYLINKNGKNIQKEKSLKTSSPNAKKNEEKNKKKKKKFNINIQIVQNNINNINNIIELKQNKDTKNKIIKYLGMMNNVEHKNNLRQKQITENILQSKQKNIIANITKQNIITNTLLKQSEINNRIGHKRQNTFNVNLNDSKLIEKYKGKQFIKINNVNKKNVAKKSIKKEKNDINENRIYFQHIRNALNKNRKRQRTPSSINAKEYLSNNIKYNFQRCNNNFVAKKKKRNKSNNNKRTKLLLPLEPSEIILSKDFCNLSNVSTKGNLPDNKKRNKNKINKIKIAKKYNPISTRKSYNQDDFLNLSLKNVDNKNSKNKSFNPWYKLLETYHKKQKSYHEIFVRPKIKNYFLNNNGLITNRTMNKNELPKKDIQRNIKSNQTRLKTKISEFKNNLVKYSFGNVKKINLKDIDLIFKKLPTNKKINFNYKNDKNAPQINKKKNICHLYKTIGKSERKKEKEQINVYTIPDNLINNNYRKIYHQKTISYNIDSSLNISNIMNPKYKYKNKVIQNLISNNKIINNQKNPLFINKIKINTKSLNGNKVQKVANRKIVAGNSNV